MSARVGLLLFSLALLLSSSLPAAEPVLAIRGQVKMPLNLSLSQIKSLPVTATEENSMPPLGLYGSSFPTKSDKPAGCVR